MGIVKKGIVGRYGGVIGAVILLTLASGCREKGEPKSAPPVGTVVARVGNSVLTLEELRASIPNEYSNVITRDQNIQYVWQWVNTELLYTEALRLGIDKEPEIKARLEKMRKDLLSSEIISRRAALDATVVSEQAIRDYYEANRDQFIRDSYVVRYEGIVVDDITTAWEIRRTATHETFKAVAKAHSKDPPGLDESTPYVPLDVIPPIIRNAVLGAAVPSITGPYRADDGFHILRVIGKFDKGTVASLDEVRDEIVARLSNMSQKNETEKLLSDIKSRSDVEFNIDLIPGVATSEENEERE